jgi:hypothetical protein
VFFDPGQSTGVAVLALDPAWLCGQGDADWAGLRRAVKSSWFAQIGEDAREWDGHKAEAGLINDYAPHRRYNGPSLSLAAQIELNMIYDAREILDYWPGACWGYEDYVPESMAAAQKGALTPMRFFSTLAFGAIMDDSRPRVPFVQSRTMKYSADDARMRLAGLYLPGMPHATDAARHAAVFARAARQKESLRIAAWPRLFDPERKRNDERQRNTA